MDDNNIKEFNTTCDACNCSFTEVEAYNQHLLAKKHSKLSKSKQRLYQRSLSLNIPATECREDLSRGECMEHRVQLQRPANKTGKRERTKESATFGGDDSCQLVCEVCNTTFAELSQYQLHASSKSHKRAVRLKKLTGLLRFYDKQLVPRENYAGNSVSPPYSFCPLCDKKFTESESYFMHMQTKNHKKRVSLQKIFNKINAQLTDSEEDEESGERLKCNARTAVDRRRSSSSASFTMFGDSFECKYCDQIFTDKVIFALHLTSKPHEKAKRKNSLLAELKDLLAEESEEGSSLSGEDHHSK